MVIIGVTCKYEFDLNKVVLLKYNYYYNYDNYYYLLFFFYKKRPLGIKLTTKFKFNISNQSGNNLKSCKKYIIIIMIMIMIMIMIIIIASNR